MFRNRWIWKTLVILIVANVFWWIYSGWGVITLHADKMPISKVVREIERQGHVMVRTDLDPETPVTMDVKRVPLAEALEVLSATTDTRWRLTYLAGPDKTTVNAGLSTWVAGKRPDNWKFYGGFGGRFMENNTNSDDDDPLPTDPRHDVWKVTAPSDGLLQSYFADGAHLVNATFAVPESWNPAIKSAPSEGELRKVVSKLISAANGDLEPVFMISQMRRRGPRDGGDQPRQNFAGGDQRWMENLPPELKGQADQIKAAFDQLKDLPDDQRRAKLAEIRQQFFNNPDMQARMIARMERRDSFKTPEQRLQRYKNYVSQKKAKTGQ